MAGFVKIHRGLREKAYYRKDSQKVHLWLHLLLQASWKEREEYLGGQKIICRPGQFTTGRKQLAGDTGIDESKVERLLTFFEKIEQQITQQKTNKNRLITIVNWDQYQVMEDEPEQQLNNKRTTNAQQLNTPKEYKEGKEGEEESLIIEIPLKIVFQKLLADEIWIEAVCMNHSIDKFGFIDYLTKFEKELSGDGVETKSINNAKQHFNRWLGYKIKHDKKAGPKTDSKELISTPPDWVTKKK